MMDFPKEEITEGIDSQTWELSTKEKILRTYRNHKKEILSIVPVFFLIVASGIGIYAVNQQVKTRGSAASCTANGVKGCWEVRCCDPKRICSRGYCLKPVPTSQTPVSRPTSTQPQPTSGGTPAATNTPIITLPTAKPGNICCCCSGSGCSLMSEASCPYGVGDCRKGSFSECGVAPPPPTNTPTPIPTNTPIPSFVCCCCPDGSCSVKKDTDCPIIGSGSGCRPGDDIDCPEPTRP